MKKLIDVLVEMDCEKEIIIKVSTIDDFKVTSTNATYLLCTLANNFLECLVSVIEYDKNKITITLY